MTQALAPCGECNVGECDRCPTCSRFEAIVSARARPARFTSEETERGLAILLGKDVPATSFADVWQHRDDMRRDPGYALENVVPVTSDEADAMQSWAEAILWASDTDSGTWTR